MRLFAKLLWILVSSVKLDAEARYYRPTVVTVSRLLAVTYVGRCREGLTSWVRSSRRYRRHSDVQWRRACNDIDHRHDCTSYDYQWRHLATHSHTLHTHTHTQTDQCTRQPIHLSASTWMPSPPRRLAVTLTSDITQSQAANHHRLLSHVTLGLVDWRK